MRLGAALGAGDDRHPALTASQGRGSPARTHLGCCRACHSELIPALCPPATGALGCHLPELGDVTGKECGGQGQVEGCPAERLPSSSGQRAAGDVET